MGLYRVTSTPRGIAYITMDTANPKTCTLGQRESNKEGHRNVDHFFSQANGMSLRKAMSVSWSTVKPELLQDNATTSEIGTSVWLVPVGLCLFSRYQ